MGESIDNTPIQPNLPSEPSKKRKISSEDASSASASQPAQKKTVSNTLSELRELVDPPLARQALQQLVDGNGGDFGPAIRNADGCLLARKSSSHKTGRYIQVHMPYEKRARGKNGETVTRRQAQLAHRVVVIAYKTFPIPTLSIVAGGSSNASDSQADEDIEKVLYGGGSEVSHLCGRGNCIEASHVVVESRAMNESRKLCQQNGKLVRASLELKDGTFVSIKSPHECPHVPPCVRREVKMVIE